MIYKRLIPMAQSEYILATYSRKPGWVNKHRILSYLILATYSQKPGRVNEHRLMTYMTHKATMYYYVTREKIAKRRQLKSTEKSKAFIGRQAKISSSMKLALATGRYALSVSRHSHYPIDILTQISSVLI